MRNINLRMFISILNLFLNIKLVKKFDEDLKKLSELINIDILYYEDLFDINSENKLRRIYARAALNSTQAIFFRKSSFFLEVNVGYNSFLGSNPIQSSNKRNFSNKRNC